MATKWFDRKFDFSISNDDYASVYERLKQAPDTLKHAAAGIPESILIHKPGGKWSVKEQTGHLSVLEPIWRIRFLDILQRKPVLTPADLDNKATDEAYFNAHTISSLLDSFLEERNKTLSLLDTIDVFDKSLTSMHPRLQQLMGITDLACFVAEHDDHHIANIKAIISSNHN